MQGGGTRATNIAAQLAFWKPDIVGLSEIRGTKPSQTIASALHEMGLTHQITTVNPDTPNQYGLLLASRFPFRKHDDVGPLQDRQRWIHIDLIEPAPMHLMIMHIPNRDEGSKYDCHDWVIGQFSRFAHLNAIAMGDTNTGKAGIDEEATFFNHRETAWFDRILQTSWLDVWRHRNPERQEYTWRTSAGIGFRLDQLFATTQIVSAITDIEYRWGNTEYESDNRKLSDHAAIVADLDPEKFPIS